MGDSPEDRMGDSPEERMIRSYLLGEMGAEERTAFQDRLAEDDNLFLRVREVEEDLTDALARGELSDADAERVRTFLQESSLAHRLPFAEALAARYARPASRPIRRVMQWWMLPLAACLILGVTALLLSMRNHRPETQVARADPPLAVPGEVYVARIPAGLVRGSGRRTVIHLPAASPIVELRLEVRAPGAYEHYRVDVAGASGQPVFSLAIPAPLPGEVPVAVTRASLIPGDYEIALVGISRDGNAQPIEYYYYTIQ